MKECATCISVDACTEAAKGRSRAAFKSLHRMQSGNCLAHVPAVRLETGEMYDLDEVYDLEDCPYNKEDHRTDCRFETDGAVCLFKCRYKVRYLADA